ncbi:HAD-IIB family hydrolase [Lentilactobacillus sp. Marseille-Q4993]|uniref:HAD-IIB family hydrolase n=1 Tax=Lentilactobacillus sp. Marseille-Q4993 TaxID=3039492 RepID=UPI0024BCD5D9|nr:HAD-IIB family hydrolase [Lentilactobacillus sp. Marseille-Q4993]
MVKVIAADMDGTFLDSKGEFDTEAFQTQLDKMAAKGMHFISASSNPYSHQLKTFSKNSGPISYICDNGALTVDEHGIIVKEEIIDPLLLHQLLDWFKTKPEFANAEVTLAGRNGSYNNMPADSDEFKATKYFYEDMQAVADLKMIFDAVYKVDVLFKDANALEMALEVNKKFGGKLVAVSSGMNGIDIMLKGVSKSAAIDELLAKWQLSFDDVAAFGDNGNDYEMISDAGEGYAVKNAAPDLTAMVPNVLELTNDEKAVQKKIDEYLG